MQIHTNVEWMKRKNEQINKKQAAVVRRAFPIGALR